jgi:uncharacterized membrane protein YkoI
MMKTWRRWAVGVAIALIAVAGSGTAVFAHDDTDDDAALAAQLAQSGDILPLEQILLHVHAEKPGKVIETELDHERGRYIYDVKVLDAEGVVWKLTIEATTGAVLRIKQDD